MSSEAAGETTGALETEEEGQIEGGGGRRGGEGRGDKGEGGGVVKEGVTKRECCCLHPSRREATRRQKSLDGENKERI